MANFPHGSEDIAAAADEVAAAVADGADEIDVLAPTEAIREGDIGIVGELVQACRIAAGERTVLKLTLDTGMLAEPDIVTAVARAAVMAGAGFLAAARGQPFSGDGLEAVATLLAACAEASGEVGLKVADAHMTAADAAACMALGDAVVGAGWASPGRFRLGGPHLLDALLALER
jgi:deoxyribose-phosphate aldolase